MKAIPDIRYLEGLNACSNLIISCAGWRTGFGPLHRASSRVTTPRRSAPPGLETLTVQLGIGKVSGNSNAEKTSGLGHFDHFGLCIRTS